MSVMTDDPPATPEVVIRREVDVIGVFGIRRREVIAERVEEFRRQPLPGAADVGLLVVDFSAVDRFSTVIGRRPNQPRPRVGPRVVVVNGADVESDIAECFFVSTIKIHFDVATGITGSLAYIRVPITEVDAARLAVVEAPLNARL